MSAQWHWVELRRAECRPKRTPTSQVTSNRLGSHRYYSPEKQENTSNMRRRKSSRSVPTQRRKMKNYKYNYFKLGLNMCLCVYVFLCEKNPKLNNTNLQTLNIQLIFMSRQTQPKTLNSVISYTAAFCITPTQHQTIQPIIWSSHSYPLNIKQSYSNPIIRSSHSYHPFPAMKEQESHSLNQNPI